MLRKASLIVTLIALVILPSGCRKSPEEARWELNQLGIQWSQEVFLERVENSDTVVVQLFLTAGMNPNGTTPYGWTPLMHSALVGHTGILRALLTAGARVNAKGDEGFTALTLAAGSGRLESLQILLDAGADVNVQDGEGWTGLMYAAEAGYLNIVELLLRHDAEVNLKSNDGDTALALAEQHGRTRIAEILKQAGALGREAPVRAAVRPAEPQAVSYADLSQVKKRIGTAI